MQLCQLGSGRVRLYSHDSHDAWLTADARSGLVELRERASSLSSTFRSARAKTRLLQRHTAAIDKQACASPALPRAI